MTDEPTTPAEKARVLLGSNSGTATERAQVWATLAVAEAVDRSAGISGGTIETGIVVGSEPIVGTVIESGGGEIRVQVGRNVSNYPAVNTEVELTIR